MLTQNNTRPILIFLMGPTASGKTALSFELAKKLPVEIISVDSAMVYRGMDIGSGKPSKEELAKVPHHLIDIRDPSEAYSAAEFAKDALIAIESITQRGKIPLLVGGTLLYFKALEQGLSDMPSATPTTREKLAKEAEALGLEKMHQRLKEIDPLSAKRIHPNDPQRLLRALEVYEITGKPMSAFWAADPKSANSLNKLDNYQIYKFAIMPKDRKILHQRIEQRFHEMLKQGLLQEVEKLYQRPQLNLNLPSMRAVGYRQVYQYCQGLLTFEEMTYQSIVATRQLAKRQLTWLRSLSDISSLEMENPLLDSMQSVLNCVFVNGGC
jgi:tRNA dimethylallyltransferase